MTTDRCWNREKKSWDQVLFLAGVWTLSEGDSRLPQRFHHQLGPLCCFISATKTVGLVNWGWSHVVRSELDPSSQQNRDPQEAKLPLVSFKLVDGLKGSNWRLWKNINYRDYHLALLLFGPQCPGCVFTHPRVEDTPWCEDRGCAQSLTSPLSWYGTAVLVL